MAKIENPIRQSIRRPVWVAGLAIITLVCGCPIIFFGFPWVDAAFCIPRAAQRIGVSASYESLYGYINRKVIPGMSRDEVTSALETIGPVEVVRSDHFDPDTTIQQVALDICLDPRNNIQVYLNYSNAGQLISYGIPND